MKLTKWSPLFDVGVESPVIPIWVSFLQLRCHLYSSCILHGLSSIFGKPLKIDTATSVGSSPSVARVLVEIDIAKSYPDKVCFAWVLLVFTKDDPAWLAGGGVADPRLSSFLHLLDLRPSSSCVAILLLGLSFC
ncbi:hypothetical protein M5K25_019475 [Dendrobium thyrsiflorum]|uniref:DUF4283 domain-containing protein n=1 Tax=Dendrobium thyrsiflorum TaxID=117978 RepID=A0ABD0UFI5_DENTH